MTPSQLIACARGSGESTLSEYDSKRLLAAYGLPVCRKELVVAQAEPAIRAARAIGYPVVLKACAPQITHKSEAGLIETDLRVDSDVAKAVARMAPRIEGKADSLLVQEMLIGPRELLLGMIRDPQFGPSVSFGLGGIYAEILDDVTSRTAPISQADALAMFDEIRGAAILGPVRGMPAVDPDVLSDALLGLARLADDHVEIAAIDVNPMIVVGSRPVAADALVVLGPVSVP